MMFLAAIWLVLQHLASGAVALPVQALPEAPRARGETNGGRRMEAAATAPRAPHDAIHASRDLRTLLVARSGWRVHIGAAPSSHPHLEGARALEAHAAQREPAAAGAETHRLAARGSLLPFFPTAPPVPA